MDLSIHRSVSSAVVAFSCEVKIVVEHFLTVHDGSVLPAVVWWKVCGQKVEGVPWTRRGETADGTCRT